MKKFRMLPAVLAAGIAATVGLGLTGCGKGSDIPEGFDGTAISFYATYVNQYSKSAYEELIKTYNNGQGVTDNVWVSMTPNAGGVNNLKSLLTNKTCRYDVLTVANTQFKELAIEAGRTRNGLFVPLDSYLTDTAKQEMGWDQISKSQINIWRFNNTTSSNIGNKYLAGEGANLLAMPFNSSAEVLFYNSDIFSKMGINMVSVEEEKCGTGDYAKLLPHGYAEYSAEYGAPYAGATTSQNDAGETVYKVFNDRVPMNWEELRCLAWSYQRYKEPNVTNGKYNYYGYMSEWWFNYGWSVGGDCIGWDYTANKYVFSIGDKDKNYLALNDITVNGTAYAQGEVLDYEDMKYLRANSSAYSAIENDLYELPSMYDAFLEFNCLGVPADKVVATAADAGTATDVKGYGIAPNTTANRDRKFTAGESPMLCESAENINSYNAGSLKGKFDIAPLAQYREYVGGSTRTVNGKECLKVIDGTNYTGELKTVENSDGDKVACVGEAISAVSSNTSALAIPRNIDESKYEGAFKFIRWACGPEGQAILAKGNTATPNQANVGMSDEFGSSTDRVVKNQWAASYALKNSYVGDWSYFNVGTWITGWSSPLNNDVRRGDMSLTTFLSEAKGYVTQANTALSTMKIRIKGK